MSAKVLQRSGGVRPAGFELTPAGTLVNLKQGDQALMVVLVLTDEIVSSENYGSYHKTFVNLRGNLLIFDYKAQTVVRTYPLSTVLFDATPNAPSPARIGQFVEDLLVGEGSQSMLSLFARRLASAELPRDGTKTLQVKRAEVAPKALEMMPEPFRQTPAMANAMVADAFASILSAKTGAPLLPNGVGAVDGVMMMRLENGDDFKLKIGEGDYLFDLKINGFVKKKLEENNVGISYVYGVYSNLRFYEPSLGTDFINSDLKNGESVVVPVSQVASDDFPGYKDAINGLYLKLSAFFAEHGAPDRRWIGTAASAKDITSQLEAAQKIIRSCK
ncbi:hypothetical protein [Propionivibrio sp.]|uniref:hypothetical protein n=1 Tax=Propionivibrio sp. TaxID=2212460 RepID=UPI0039E3FB0B